MILAALNLLAAAVAATIAGHLLAPSNPGWRTKTGAAVNGTAALALLHLALFAVWGVLA